MTTFRRRPEREPEVYFFPSSPHHRDNMIQGHYLAAWALSQGSSTCETRAKSISVRPADDGMTARGVHVIGMDDAGNRLFNVHPEEALVWENEEFRVYNAIEFSKVFEPLPEVVRNV